MRKNKMILLVIMILPWLSMPFMGKRTIKRLFPGAIFMFIWVAVESILAKKRVWWRIYERIIPKVIGELPFMLGPFFVGSLWILKWTFGNFTRYLFLNLIFDTLFAYPGMFILKRLGIASLVRLRPYQMVILFMSKSVIMYGLQSSADKLRKKPKSLFQKLFS
ncbi:hypothetical protein [Neobacillus sp. SuZ13]|uniref:hypothetical protein n=1 Tax=Neobacillus sp. SuZ13 TaxID=3047875 RepID=UPI0024C061DA|nr:hypothetical protein [Neobacillus sp. SuZ13]WHY67868.1 hypothetical protein QNH17_04250 [Neobacillus sp. SuZ13]